MRDFLPADVRKREYVIGIIKEVYESYGFEPLETPAVENLDTLTGKYGEEGNQLIFRILKRGEKLDLAKGTLGGQTLESTIPIRVYIRNIAKVTNEAFDSGNVTAEMHREVIETLDVLSRSMDAFEDVQLSDLALRYDLTVPFARIVAHHKNELPKFFKRYQIQPVWRADRPARGRFREFYQCDVDAIGSTSMVVEAELISAASEILTRLGFGDFEIRVNSRELLRSILNVSGFDSKYHSDVLVSLDKLDKIGGDAVFNELKLKHVPLEPSYKLFDFLSGTLNRSIEIRKSSQSFESISKSIDDGLPSYDWSGSKPKLFDDEAIKRNLERNHALIEGITDFIGSDGNGENALQSLRQLIDWSGTSPAAKYVSLDPTLARGLSYYTGTIFEINVPDLAGSLGGGGRYDGLIGMFGKEQIPACGFSLGLERILVVMEERGMFPPEIAESAPAHVMVTIWNKEAIAESLKLAAELRSQKRKDGKPLRVTVYPEPDKFAKQMKYADQIRVPYVCILGETELAEGKVTLKDMRTGEQQSISRKAVGQIVSEVFG
jgi:histidyl-tRNA synthetase